MEQDLAALEAQAAEIARLTARAEKAEAALSESQAREATLHRAFPAASQPEAEPVAGPDDPPCTDCDGTGITFQTERRCACQGPTPAPVVPAEGLERAREDEAKAGWVLDMELLKELRSDAGDWGYSLDLEAVEAIALEVEKRLRAQQPAAPVSGVTVKPLVWEPLKPEDALCHDHWVAPALGGAFHMAPDEDSAAGAWLMQWTIRHKDFCMVYGGAITSHPSPEDAQAAAQSDYEARILSALEAE